MKNRPPKLRFSAVKVSLLERRGPFGDIDGGRGRAPQRTVVESHQAYRGDQDVVKSVLEAIKQGVWDFEPEAVEDRSFSSTRAMPGTDEKLEVLAERVRAGLPLWHGGDRTDYDEEA